MFFKKQKKDNFEKAFADRLGQSPVDFIFTKLSVGSDKKAVEYLYDITATEIVRQKRCKVKPFSCFYPEAEQKLQAYLRAKAERDIILNQQKSVYKSICICQREFLNRKDSRPFGAQCGSQLDLLYSDTSFCNGIAQIGRENADIEFCENPQSHEFLRFKREILPRRMAELGLTEHPMVQSICEYIVRNGKSRKSALITVYYAIRMYLLKCSISE